MTPADVRVGVEVHVQLATGRKLFCPCAPGDVCPVCRGEPGTLPVLDPGAVRLAVRAAHALGADVHLASDWTRKHYDWPDLPRGYQRTQGTTPLASGGRIAGLPLVRMHLEEDAGRIVNGTVDDGRAGVALLEIVSPAVDIDPAGLEDALGWLRRVLVAADVTHGRIEQGHWRVDLNVSLAGGARVEIKNVGGIGSVARALRVEIGRQRGVLARGGTVDAETRAWDGQTSRPLRAKAPAPGAGYRWLNEPDLPPLDARHALEAEVRPTVPLEQVLRTADAEAEARLARDGIPPSGARFLLAEPERHALYADSVARGARPRTAADLLARLDRRGVTALPAAADVAAACDAVDSGRASRDGAVDALAHAGSGPRPWDATADDDATPDPLPPLVAALLDAEPALVRRLLAGERSLEGHFVGRAMHATGRRIPAPRVVEAVRAALSARYVGASEAG